MNPRAAPSVERGDEPVSATRGDGSEGAICFKDERTTVMHLGVVLPRSGDHRCGFLTCSVLCGQVPGRADGFRLGFMVVSTEVDMIANAEWTP